MLSKIKQAQEEGKILSNIVVDYSSVVFTSPIQTIYQSYPDIRKATKENIINYSILDINSNASKDIKIQYMENFKPDYYIVRTSTHDGTLYFTTLLYEDVITDVVIGAAYCKGNNPYNYSKDFWDYDIEYTLGNIYHFMDFGIKDINGREMHGQTDIMVMPVKIKYVKNNDGIYEASQ